MREVLGRKNKTGRATRRSPDPLSQEGLCAINNRCNPDAKPAEEISGKRTLVVSCFMDLVYIKQSLSRRQANWLATD